MYKITHNIVSQIICDVCKGKIGFVLTDQAQQHPDEIHICEKCKKKYKEEIKCPVN